jgi:hypothetical protein
MSAEAYDENTRIASAAITKLTRDIKPSLYYFDLNVAVGSTTTGS